MFRAKKTETKRHRKLFPFLNERGNILVWYVMMFPVFLGGVGVAVDFANVTAVRVSLQASLDAAAQGTVALSKNQASGKPRFTSAALAQSEAIKLYDANRSGISQAGRVKEGIPFLICQTTKTGSGTLVTPSGSRCGFTLTSFKYSGTGAGSPNDYLTITVKEKADTIFLKILGFDDLTYTITSTARLTNTYN